MSNLKKITKYTLLAGMLAGFSLSATAATQGSLGTTSTGTTNISLTIPALVKISDLDDITLGTLSNITSNVKGDTQACIYSNSAAGGYRVTVTGSGTGNAFTVADGSGNDIAYTAYWKDDITAGDGTQLTSGSQLSGQLNADTTSITCANTGKNAKFTVEFGQGALAAAPQGSYTGTATITIAPQ